MDQPEAAIHLSQQQRPGVRRDRSAVEPGNNRLSLNRFKFEQLLGVHSPSAQHSPRDCFETCTLVQVAAGCSIRETGLQEVA